MILSEAHEGVSEIHYVGKAMAQNILCTRRWWPTLHKDAKKFCQTCDVGQRIGNPSKRDDMTLVPQLTLQDFDKLEIDFVGPINPLVKRSGARYIIIVTYYLSRWVEAEPVRDCNINTIA
jgi:hypothetical protein